MANCEDAVCRLSRRTDRQWRAFRSCVCRNHRRNNSCVFPADQRRAALPRPAVSHHCGLAGVEPRGSRTQSDFDFRPTLALANAALVYAFVFGANPLSITPTAWLRPAHLSREDKINLKLLVDSTCNRTNIRGANIVGVEYPELNANSASFYSAKKRRTHGQRCYYTSLGYAVMTTEHAMQRMDLVAPDYFVTVAPSRQRPPDFLNVASRSVAELVAGNPRFVLSPGSGDYLLVYRRTP